MRSTRQKVQLPTPRFFLQYNGITADEAKPLNIPATLPFEEVTFAGPVNLGGKIDPVFLMGDSSVPFAGVYPKGAGIRCCRQRAVFAAESPAP